MSEKNEKKLRKPYRVKNIKQFFYLKSAFYSLS